MKKSKLFLLLLFLPALLAAQVDTLGFNKIFVKKCWSDTKTAFTAPVHWDGRDWATFGAVTATTAAIFLVDEPVVEGFQNFRTHSGEGGERFSADFLEPWDIDYSLAVIGGFLGYGLLANDSKSQSTGLLALESFALASLLVQIPKRLIGRARPDSGTDVDPYQFDGPLQDTSLPSGHTTAVFAVASVIANQYADTRVVPVISYTVAAAVGLSRIYDGRHWLSDVVAGAALGIAVGNLVSPNKNKSKRVVLIPFTSKKMKGIRLALTL